MKNPMWFVEENLEKVKASTRALGRELFRLAGALSGQAGLDAKFATEILMQVVHRLVLAMVELGLLSLVRQLMHARPLARIYPLPGRSR